MNNYFTTIAIGTAFFSALTGVAVPNFSLHNKMKTPIKYSLKNANMTYSGVLEAGKFFDQDIDISEKTSLEIANSWVNGMPASFVFDRNKTIYVNWDLGKKLPLYPQRGPLMGLTNKTDQGYSTKNNVSISGIMLVRAPGSGNQQQPKPYVKNKAFIDAGLPDPKDPDFCKIIRNEAAQLGTGTLGYKKVSLKYHPDKCKSDQKLCNEVFQVLPPCFGKGAGSGGLEP